MKFLFKFLFVLTIFWEIIIYFFENWLFLFLLIKALEFLLLNQMIKNLDDILKDKMLILNEKDKKNLFDLLKNEDEKKVKA